jgi:hypothetical protein
LLANLTADFEKATSEKLKCQQEADATNQTIQLANRLINGLASENVRWAESVAKYVNIVNVSPMLAYENHYIKYYYSTFQFHAAKYNTAW